MGAITFTVGQFILFVIFLLWFGYVLNNTLNKPEYKFTSRDYFFAIVWWASVVVMAVGSIVAFFVFLF